MKGKKKKNVKDAKLKAFSSELSFQGAELFSIILQESIHIKEVLRNLPNDAKNDVATRGYKCFKLLPHLVACKINIE